MRSGPDVRSGVSDSTSPVGGFSKKEEAGSYCLARIFVLSSRLLKKTVPMWYFQLVFSVTNQGSVLYLVSACCRTHGDSQSRNTDNALSRKYLPTPSCDEETFILCSHILLVKRLRARP